MNPDPITLLVVDDHPVVRDGLIGLLDAQPGLAVVGEAGDGVEAIAMAEHTKPDVVVMDLRMPGGSGVDAIRELRRRHPQGCRILVLTTYDTDRDIREAMRAGADGYLLKDAAREELVRAVHEVAQGRPVLTAAALAALSGPVSEETGSVLSPRETEVLRLVATGMTNRAIASRLRIGEATVKTHLLHIYDKLGAVDRASAVHAASRGGLI
ncbi:response regulator transcription factor [Nocardiopsis sp. NPDC049922]|uniref:response regulator transcription factor n=1 Tax=Nocardiopsis sp. NPDC049922 TaxID=3155157 RepID=UPI0033C29FEF